MAHLKKQSVIHVIIYLLQSAENSAVIIQWHH